MLEYQIEKLMDKHKSNTLKLEPFLLKISGYNSQESRLKIGDYFLHCTPAAFSLTSCKVIVVLGKKEYKYFDEFQDKFVAFNLAFDPTFFGKSVSFFIKGKLTGLINIRDSIYTVNLEGITLSNLYKEVFLYLSEMTSIYKKIYDSNLNTIENIGNKKFPVTYTQIMFPNKGVINASLKSISANKFYIEKSTPQLNLELNKKYSFKIFYYKQQIKLTGTVIEDNDSIYTALIDYNTEFIHTFSKYLQITQKQDMGQTEELEEL